MAFSIKDFNAQLHKHGLAQSNLFVLKITLNENLTFLEENMATQDMTFLCRSAEVPEVAVQTVDFKPRGYGPSEKRPNGFELPLLPTVFMVDSNFAVMKFFHRWMQKVINYDTSAGPISEVDGALPFEMGYKRDYATTIEIIVYSFQSESITYTYKMSGAYPIQVGNITEAWEANGEIMTLPVGFTYDELKVSGAKTGNVISGASGANGLLSYLSSINTFTQAIRGLKRPRSIQDAINQVSNVSTILKSF